MICPNDSVDVSAPDNGCVVLFIGELHRCTELLFYSPVDVTETVVKFTSLSLVTHRFNQAGSALRCTKKSKQSDTPTFGLADDRWVFFI